MAVGDEATVGSSVAEGVGVNGYGVAVGLDVAAVGEGVGIVVEMDALEHSQPEAASKAAIMTNTAASPTEIRGSLKYLNVKG